MPERRDPWLLVVEFHAHFDASLRLARKRMHGVVHHIRQSLQQLLGVSAHFAILIWKAAAPVNALGLDSGLQAGESFSRPML